MKLGNTRRFFWKLGLRAVLAVLLMFPAAAAESLSEIICDVKQQPNGFYMYLLSKPAPSTECETCWEDINGTAIARNTLGVQTIDWFVHSLTNQSTILKKCVDNVRYTQDCLGAFEEASCRVNCSWGDQPNTVNSTLTCISESWCPDPWKFGLIIAAVFIFVAVVVGLLLCKTSTCKRGVSCTGTTTYIPANEQIKVEMEGANNNNNNNNII